MRVNFPGSVPIPKPEDKSMAAAVAPTKSATLKEAEPMLRALGLQSQSCTCTSTSWQEQAALRCDAELVTEEYTNTNLDTNFVLPDNLAEIIETELKSWRSISGGVYTIHAASVGIAAALYKLERNKGD